MVDTRTRQRLHAVTADVSGTLSLYGNAVNTYSRTLGFNDLGEETTDQVTPGFFALKRAGAHLPVNPYTNKKSDIILDTPVAPYTYTEYRRSTGETRYSGSYFLQQALGKFEWQMSSLRNQAINVSQFPNLPNSNRLLQMALANAKTSAFDMGTFLAEANKTFRLLKTAKDTFWKRAFRVEKAIKGKRKAKSADNLINLFSEVWLESRYGWRQLYFDMKNAHEAYLNMSKAMEGALIRFTAYDENSHNSVNSNHQPDRKLFCSSVSSHPVGLLWDYKTTTVQTAAVRAGVGVVPRAAGSFSFFDPFVTGWEIVPFSFIVDWFFNIGQAIAAWSPTGRVSLQHGFVTHMYTEDFIVDATARTFEQGASFDSTSAGGHHRMTLRRTYTQRFPAEPTFNLSFNLNLDPAKIVDLLTITKGQARKFLRQLKH